MAAEIAFEYTVETREKSQRATPFWSTRLPVTSSPRCGSRRNFWTMDRFRSEGPPCAKQWVGATSAAAADFAARILTNFFANEGMEVVRRTICWRNVLTPATYGSARVSWRTVRSDPEDRTGFGRHQHERYSVRAGGTHDAAGR